MKMKMTKGAVGVVAIAALAGCSDGTNYESDMTTSSDQPASATVVSVMDPYATGCTVKSHGVEARAFDETVSPGRYFFNETLAYKVTASNCTDAATGKTLPTMSSPVPSTSDQGVVTPFTTIVDEMMVADPTLEAGATAAAAASYLGLTVPTGTDLLNYDPLASVAADPTTAIAVQAVSNQLTATMTMLEAATGDSAASAAALAAGIAATADAGAGATFDLTDSATIEGVATDAGVTTGAASVATAVAALNGEIQTAADSYAGDAQAVVVTMTAATSVAVDLTVDVESAVAGDSTALDDATANVTTLVSDAETTVVPDGLTSTEVTEEDVITSEETGATGSGS